MKAPTRWLVAVFAAFSWMTPAGFAGPKILLYPLARAFGSPSEAELAKCRQAFAHLQTSLASSRVVVEPVMFVAGGARTWRPDLAEAIVRQARTQTAAKFEPAGSAPAAVPTPFGHNQLRYTWERAAAYSRWAREMPPPGDYVWVCEIWGREGKVAAIQVYVLEASGQVAYCRLFNSHQLGANLPLAGDAAIAVLIKQFFTDLSRDPRQVFPPYGVG